MEIIFELLLEGVLYILGELLVELGYRSLGETMASRHERNPILAGIGYGLIGTIAGFLSLLIFPEAIVRSETFHGINMLISPLLAGLGMAGFGWLLERSGKRRLRLDSFIFGFVFAFPMAIIRFFFTS